MLFWIHIFTLYFKNINHFAHTLDKIYLKKTLPNYGFKKKKYYLLKYINLRSCNMCIMTQNENDVSKNWCLALCSQKTKFKGKSIPKIHWSSRTRITSWTISKELKDQFSFFCCENIGMLCFIIRSHARTHKESKIIQEVD